MSTSRTKTDPTKSARQKSRQSPEPESPELMNANGAMLQSIKVMMEEMRSDIVSKFETIISETVKREIQSALKTFDERITANKTTINDLEKAANEHDSQLAELQANVTSLTATVESMGKKCEDLEARSRLNNVRLIGVPEGAEGSRPTDFIASLLQDLLGLEAKPLLDRAHRTLRAKPKQGEPPRPIVIRVNRFPDRNLILQRASKASPLMFNGRRIHIFPDFVPTVAKQRAAFAAVKKELRDHPGVRFGLRYPATLLITLPSGQEKRFENPDSAMDFVKKFKAA